MGSTREKGKIPNSEWPKIVARYNGGETIASIGRAYGCTAPAIRYIVKRSGMLKGDAVRKRPFGASEPLIRQQSSRSDTLSDPAGDRARSEIAGLRAAGRVTREPVLGTELRKRVSGDVASFLVALDQAVLDGSVDSIVNLQEATDCLMRSTARTRLELERQLSRYDGAAPEQDGRKKVASAPPRDA
jgi:hypothetical protein